MALWTPASGTDATAGPRPLADPDGVRAPSPLAADLGLATRGSSLWRDGVRRLRRNRLAMAGGAVIVVLCYIAIFADVLADRKSTRLNSSHGYISYAVFCLKKKKYNRVSPVSSSSSLCR